MAITIQLRRDIESAFNSNGTVAAVGEMLVATDTHNAVIGDGTTTFQAMVAANRHFKFEDGDGGRVFGGNEANETVSIKGNATQTVPIFKVVNSSDQSILEVTDNDAQLVKIDSSNAEVDDINLLLKAKASQTAEVIAVTDSGNIVNFSVKEDGQTLIDPNDTTDPSLKVIGSAGSQSNGILRVEDTNNNAVLLVKSDGVQSEQTVTVDGSSIIAQANGDATSNVTLVGTTDENAKAITVDDGGTENFSVTAGGKIDSKDMEISATSRSLVDASVARVDELLGAFLPKINPVEPSTVVNATNFPVGSIRTWTHGSDTQQGPGSQVINFAALGDEMNADSTTSMANAPLGKYLVLGWGLQQDSSANDEATFKDSNVKIVDHDPSIVFGEDDFAGNTPVFTIAANRSAAGFVVRLT